MRRYRKQTAHDEHKKKKSNTEDGKRLTSWKVMPCLVPSDFIRILAPLDASPEGMGTDCDHKATRQKKSNDNENSCSSGWRDSSANRA